MLLPVTDTYKVLMIIIIIDYCWWYYMCVLTVLFHLIHTFTQ